MRDLRQVVITALILVLAVGAGLWAAFRTKSAPAIALTMDASVQSQLLSEPVPMKAPTITRIQVGEADPQITGALNEVNRQVTSAKMEDFNEWGEQILSKLPNKEELLDLTDHEVESTPELLREGAAMISELVAYAESNPEVKPQAVVALKACALDPEGLDAIRAYCYAKAVRLNIELGGEFWDPQELSVEIKSLSRDL